MSWHCPLVVLPRRLIILTAVRIVSNDPRSSLVLICTLSPRSALQWQLISSTFYSVGDLIAIALTYKATIYAEQFISPEFMNLPDPRLYTAVWVTLWALYGFTTGLISTGLWVIAHECGHQAFSESKLINNTVGWVLHSA